MPHRTKNDGEVADDLISFRTTAKLKRDFQKAVEDHESLPTMTDFLEECVKALVRQMRSGQTPVYPIEFVSEKSKRD